jgi:alanine dehydrogenase
MRAVEKAFVEYGKGQSQMPSKIYLNLPKHNGDFRAMPSYLSGIKSCALKWVNVHPNNVKKGLPTVMATIILSDPNTGFPLSIMEGTHLTSLRTAAAGGVAAKYLAKKDSHVVALVGCGEQAVWQLEALRCHFKVKEVNVWGHKAAIAKSFVKKVAIKKEEMHISSSVKQCVGNADIIVTTTPSKKPLIKNGWVKEGAHINAIGADAKGKQEIDSYLIRDVKVVIDNWAQAAHSGEINVPLSKKIITKKHIYSELSDVILGKKKGRVNKKEITVFDSTGLAIQDLAVAHFAYKAALKNNIGKKL